MNTRFKQTALTSVDSYKLGHADQYPAGTTKVYSNFTPRSMTHFRVPEEYNDGKIVWFGLQLFLYELKEIWDETFFNVPEDEVVLEFQELVAPFVGPKGFDVERLRELHKLGYLPLEIKAIAEGSRVNIGIPVLTITNTVPSAFWLPNFLETWMSSALWKSSTSATTSYVYRRIINKYAELTGGSKEFIQWQGHDFSVRGMSGITDAAYSGAGHLLSFTGTDNIPALKAVNDAYSGKETFVGGSVPATEHSTMCAGGKEDEIETFRRLLKTYPSGVVSIVSDTWDFWNVITVMAAELKSDIMARVPDQFGLAKVVFRPDSGDPVKIITGYNVVEVASLDDSELFSAVDHVDFEGIVMFDGAYYQVERVAQEWQDSFLISDIDECVVKGAVETLAVIFGTTENVMGYKTLNARVGLIYGDSITPQRTDAILSRLAAKKYASDNVVFGIGSYTFQYQTRDTLGFAMKATYVEVGGEGRAIFKEPKTDNGTKKSAKGLLRVDRNGDNFALTSPATQEQENGGALQRVFLNGKVYRPQKFADIRAQLGAL